MSFSTLGLSDALLRAVADQGYASPTPIQRQAIPAVLTGGDVLAGVSELPNGCGVSVRLLGRTSKTVRAALTTSWQAVRLALLDAPTPNLRKG